MQGLKKMGVGSGTLVSVKARDTVVPRSQAGWMVPRAPRCWTLSGWGARESHRAARRPGARGRAGRLRESLCWDPLASLARAPPPRALPPLPHSGVFPGRGPRFPFWVEAGENSKGHVEGSQLQHSPRGAEQPFEATAAGRPGRCRTRSSVSGLHALEARAPPRPLRDSKTCLPLSPDVPWGQTRPWASPPLPEEPSYSTLHRKTD